MYIIVNKTKSTQTKVIGNFPDLELYYELGHDIYVISLYSMTIKIPIANNINDRFGKRKYTYNQSAERYQVEFIEYPLPENIIKEELLINKGK
jgi:hypothetical protein